MEKHHLLKVHVEWDIRRAADMEIVAPSFKQYGAIKVAVHESWLNETLESRDVNALMLQSQNVWDT